MTRQRAGAPDKGAEEGGCARASAARAAPLWDSTLRFWNDEWERDYWAWVGAPVLGFDAAMHCFGTLFFVGVVLKHRYSALVLLAALPMALAGTGQIAWMHVHPRSYARWRNWNLAALRVAIVAATSVIMCETSDQATTVSLGLAASLVFTSNITALCIMALALRLPFRTHAGVQMASVCISTLFSPSYCSKWGDEFEASFQAISSGINKAMSTLLLTDKELSIGPQGAGCASVLNFLQWCVGLLLPTAFVYCSEAYSRTVYLVAKRAPEGGAPRRLWEAWGGAVVVSLWGALVGGILVWVALGIAQVMRNAAAC